MEIIYKICKRSVLIGVMMCIMTQCLLGVLAIGGGKNSHIYLILILFVSIGLLGVFEIIFLNKMLYHINFFYVIFNMIVYTLGGISMYIFCLFVFLYLRVSLGIFDSENMGEAFFFIYLIWSFIIEKVCVFIGAILLNFIIRLIRVVKRYKPGDQNK